MRFAVLEALESGFIDDSCMRLQCNTRKNKRWSGRLRRFSLVFADPVGARVAPLGVQELPIIGGVAGLTAANPVQCEQLLRLAK